MPVHTAESQFNLGNSLRAAGKVDQAIAAYARAIEIRPDFLDAHFRLGNSLAAAGRSDAAAESFRRVLRLNANHVDALNNLGNTVLGAGNAEEAIALYRRVLSIDSKHFLAWNNLAAALLRTAEFDDAIAAAQHAIAIRANYPPAHRNLGDALTARGRWAEAADSYRTLIQLGETQVGSGSGFAADARLRLGEALKQLGRVEETIDLLRQAVALAPEDFEPRDRLASLYWASGDMDPALLLCRESVQRHPMIPQAHHSLGNVFLECGRLGEAMACYDKTVQLQPSNFVADSLKVFATLFHPDYDSSRIFREAKRWEHLHAWRGSVEPHSNYPAPDRVLRVGYVSADFRDHVVGRNLLPLFQHTDRTQFQTFCYSNATESDRFTAQYRSLADGWRDVATWPDETLAAQIRADWIDILVDLSLHLGGSRLTIFSRKPAPVQVTFGGYPGTTGLGAIDYRLTDPYLDPPDDDTSAYIEQSIRLPHSFWCYDPAAMEVEDFPAPAALPVVSFGQITFGCLNNFRKVNDRVLELWSDVLKRVKPSRLLILAPRGSHRGVLVDRLGQLGVEAERIGFVDRGSREHYLKAYRLIDIALDTVPYNGHTTSLDAMWMGVPVVTLIGSTVAGRAGWSQMSNLGLTELVARTREEFTAIAVRLAEDLPRLTELRVSLRPRMLASPLRDSAGWTHGIEMAYREVWRRWCEMRQP